ncbi:putative leucine-rich repeat-containing protein DDB_G0290503 [Anthonomus grandis grandis]|uniref:putative leucine-rich repeat-containing protein DDB_G0290503 n=1 Tax=Anthonomus grandis grandis TaxID=2921223 RepID=UPI002166BE77|nr:putative leucine-rich repeat-containing protein DDB_G0290503 [Anthonomus grandis grandis]
MAQKESSDKANYQNPPLTNDLTFKSNTLPASLPNPSTSSVKIRKSSNIFTALVRKAKRKKTPKNDAVKNIHFSSNQNLSGSSTMSLAAHIEEEVELNSQNFEKKCSQNQQEVIWESQMLRSETNTSNPSEVSSSKTAANLFALREIQSGQLIFNGNDPSRSNYVQREKCRDEKCPSVMESFKDDILLSSFINYGKPPLDITHTNALLFLQETINGLQESESHILGLLVKYIGDPEAQKDLKDAITNHAKMQWEAERRSCSLANDIWMQHLEVGRTQEKVVQNTLNSLIRQNRQLQIENESLYRKYEKACKVTRGYPDHKNRYQDWDSQVDSLLRHNEKLQIKLESLFKKIESLESELHMFQKQNDGMEDQLRSYTLKMQNMKGEYHKLKTDYEIELVSVNFKLNTKENILKEALEVGDILLDDLETLKNQLKSVPFALNWTNLKIKGNCLTDLIHICRSCINELSKELLHFHNENVLKDKDLSALKETNKSLQENLKKSISELDVMVKKVEEISGLVDEKSILEQKCKILEGTLRTSEEKAEQLRLQYEGEKSISVHNVTNTDKFLQELQEKDKIIEQTKLFVANITTENYSLQNELSALHKIIKETGAGDILKEIEHKQEELQYVKKEVDKLRDENIQLKLEKETTKSENTVLANNHEVTLKTIQRQVKDIEKLESEVNNLKQKLDTEHQTTLSLQTERMKYLEEKNILKSIIHHLKTEMMQQKELEGHLANVKREASKLNVMAEYSKKQGEKLKEEILERDRTINELQNNMQKLNEIQIQHAKEKLALCQELNEVSQLKDKLNDGLNNEVKKNVELGHSKEAMAKSVQFQMQRLEEKYRNEKTAIRILLRDLKAANEEKEHAVQEKHKLIAENDQLKCKLSDLQEKFNGGVKELALKHAEISELRKDIDRNEKLHKESNTKLENETSKYEVNIKQLKKLIEHLRDDKKTLETSNDYLKNNIEKLNKDLNCLREKEKSMTETINHLKKELDATKQSLQEATNAATNLQKEKEHLTEEKYKIMTEKGNLGKENEYLNSLMEKIVDDFEKSIRSSEDKENLFKDELDATKRIIFDYEKDNQDLKQSLDIKEKRIQELLDLCDKGNYYEKKCLQLKEELGLVEKDCQNLKDLKKTLENQLIDLQDDQKRLTIHITHMEKDTNVLESQLKIVLEQKEEDYMLYKKHFAELTRAREESEEKHKKTIENLESQVKELTGKLQHEKRAYETLSQLQKEVSGKFMKSIKDLVEVKNVKQHLMEKSKREETIIMEKENEKRELEVKIQDFTEKLEKSNREIIELKSENEELKMRCNKLSNKIRYLDAEVLLKYYS